MLSLPSIQPVRSKEGKGTTPHRTRPQLHSACVSLQFAALKARASAKGLYMLKKNNSRCFHSGFGVEIKKELPTSPKCAGRCWNEDRSGSSGQ